jgi:hypothetical protein
MKGRSIDGPQSIGSYSVVVLSSQRRMEKSRGRFWGRGKLDDRF